METSRPVIVKRIPERLNMKQALDSFDRYEDGDVVIANDAYLSGPLCTHAPDVHILRPIFHAGRRRLRPILMTALATIFGMLPLAIGVGSGAQLLQPLAIAVIGGVTVSMVLSLLITPALFFVLRQRGL